MADDLPNIHSLLESLLSSNNEIRVAAEKVYDGVPVSNKLDLLLQAIALQDLPPEARSLSAVLIRRVFTTNFEDFWPQINADVQSAVKQQLLLAVQREIVLTVCRKICDAVAELIRNLTDDDGINTWPEALKFLFECAASNHINLKLSALHIFRCVPSIFGNQQTQYLEVIKQMLIQNLKNTESPEVRFDAIKTTCAFLQENDKETSLLNYFRDTLPFVIEGVAASIEAQTDDALLQCLVDLAENIPKFLRSQLDQIINMCLKALSDCNLGDEWRQMSAEVIVTLSETASAMLRKHSKFMPLLVPQLLAMMVDLEEDEEWAFKDDDDEDDTDSNSMAAESALDRLACGIGGKTMLPHIISNVPQMLLKEDWRYRHAALMAISACGEGCHQQMESMLANIVDTVIPFMNDLHPRVRYAACNAIGQMCTDFAPNFQKKFHQRICPSLLEVMNDDMYPRVQAHAAAALVNFSEDCPKTLLSTYLDAIILCLEEVLIRKFKELLEKGTKMVLEQIVTTLASVADTAEEKFIQYYDKFMPQLKYILQNAVNPELKVLRGKTIECISLIGLAVGKEKFMQDCNDVMHLLLKTQTDQSDLADDDPQVSYMMSAWARMCKILGKDFQQFLPLVMGPVLKAASLKPEVTLIDSDDVKGMDGDTDWQFVTLGDQQSFGIRTAGLEEKSTACQMLVCYARELKEAFSGYAEEVVKIMVPLLKFYFHDEVRSSATESLPYLLECAGVRGYQYTHEMWTYICPNLLKAIDMEPEKAVLPEHLHAMAKCIELLGVGSLGDEYMNDLLKNIDKILLTHTERQESRQEQRKDEDYDEVVEEALLNEDDEDVYILSKVADVLHSLFGTHKEQFLPLFEKLASHFVKLLGEDRPWPDRQWSLCVWCDLIEHTGPHSVKYKELFLKRLLECICDEQAEVRQAAAYGLGVMGQCGGDAYATHCSEAMPLLLRVIQDPQSRELENLPATENAISAVTKICKHNSSSINVDEVLPHWLSWLPVWEDEEEAVWIYSYMCDLIELNHPLILGQQNSNLPRILGIIAETFSRETVSSNVEVSTRMLNIVRQVQANESMYQACMGQLSQEHRSILSEALTVTS